MGEDSHDSSKYSSRLDLIMITGDELTSEGTAIDRSTTCPIPGGYITSPDQPLPRVM
jgi:hypothetical protein